MKLFGRKAAYPVAVASVVTTLGGLGLAYAHPFGDGKGPGFGGRHHCGGGPHGRFGRHGFGMMGQRIDGMLAFVKTELKITPEQEDAWQEFATAMRESAREGTQFRAAMKEQFKSAGKDASLVQRIDRRLSMMEQGTGHLKRTADAVKSLYASLTPEQQQLADELVPMRRL